MDMFPEYQMPSDKDFLRGYQTDDIKKLGDKVKEKKFKVVYCLPTGGGKTVTFCRIVANFVRRNPGRRAIVAVHRQELLGQTRNSLYKREGIIAEPIEAGKKHLPPASAYVGMVETVHRRLAKNPQWLGDVGLLVIDEGHLDNFSKLLPFFVNVIVICVSATPISSNKRKPMKDFYDDIVVGPQIRQLIEWGNLAPNITFNAQSVDRSQLKKGANIDGFDTEAMAATYSVGRHVDNCVKAYEDYLFGKKTLIFNCNKDHSKIVNEAFLRKGYNSRHVDSDAPDHVRKEALAWFARTPDAIMNNIGILTTGYDEPSIRGVIVNKSTESVPLWLQMTGRGSRPYPGKDFFSIIDMGGNALRLGDWCEDRDWYEIFHNPDKPSEGGIGGVKECPNCHALIPVSSNTCRWCNEVIVESREQVYDRMEVEFKVITKKIPLNINIAQIVEQNKNAQRSSFYPIHQIKNEMIRHYRVTDMTDGIAYEMLNLFQEKVEEWCRHVGHNYDQFMKEKTAKWLFDELKELYSWSPPMYDIQF